MKTTIQSTALRNLLAAVKAGDPIAVIQSHFLEQAELELKSIETTDNYPPFDLPLHVDTPPAKYVQDGFYVFDANERVVASRLTRQAADWIVAAANAHLLEAARIHFSSYRLGVLFALNSLQYSDATALALMNANEALLVEYERRDFSPAATAQVLLKEGTKPVIAHSTDLAQLLRNYEEAAFACGEWGEWNKGEVAYETLAKKVDDARCALRVLVTKSISQSESESRTPNGFDPRWVAAINTVLSDRDIEDRIQITDLNDKLWSAFLGPMCDALEEENFSDIVVKVESQSDEAAGNRQAG